MRFPARHIWADRFEGVVADLFDFEDEIATRVTGALRPSIWEAEIALARRKRPENVAAYDLVLRALPHLWAHRQDDNDEAIRLLDEAMATRSRTTPVPRRSPPGRGRSTSSITGRTIWRRSGRRATG